MAGDEDLLNMMELIQKANMMSPEAGVVPNMLPLAAAFAILIRGGVGQTLVNNPP